MSRLLNGRVMNLLVRGTQNPRTMQQGHRSDVRAYERLLEKSMAELKNKMNGSSPSKGSLQREQ